MNNIGTGSYLCKYTNWSPTHRECQHEAIDGHLTLSVERKKKQTKESIGPKPFRDHRIDKIY